MDEALRRQWLTAQQDQRISEAINREHARLRNFIRKRVADQGDAEDILQDVFYELVEAYRMMKPVEQVTAWLFRVARNRITDLFRRKKRESSRNEPTGVTDDGEVLDRIFSYSFGSRARTFWSLNLTLTLFQCSGTAGLVAIMLFAQTILEEIPDL